MIAPRANYKLTRKGRLAVCWSAVNDIQNGPIGATMTQVARHMRLQPSTYVMDLLNELERASAVYHLTYELTNGSTAKMWYITPPPEETKENTDGIRQAARNVPRDARSTHSGGFQQSRL